MLKYKHVRWSYCESRAATSKTHYIWFNLQVWLLPRVGILILSRAYVGHFSELAAAPVI